MISLSLFVITRLDILRSLLTCFVIDNEIIMENLIELCSLPTIGFYWSEKEKRVIMKIYSFKELKRD